MEEDDVWEGAIVAIMPSGGWMIEYELMDEGALVKYREPLVCWGLQKSGCVVPLMRSGNSYLEEVTDVNDSIRVFHPDEGLSP